MQSLRNQLPIIDESPLFVKVKSVLSNLLQATSQQMQIAVNKVGVDRELSLGLSLSLLSLHHQQKIQLIREQDFLQGIPVRVPYSVTLPDIGPGESRVIHKIKMLEEEDL